MKTIILASILLAIGLTSGFAIAQVDPLSESVDTIQSLEVDKERQIIDLEIATAGFDAEIQALNNEIAIDELERDTAKTALEQKLITQQALLNQVLVELNSP